MENEKEMRQHQLHMEQLKMLAAMTTSMTSISSKMMDFMSDKRSNSNSRTKTSSVAAHANYM